MSSEDDLMEIENDALTQRQALQKQSLPWVEKYRPESLHDLVSQDHIVNTCMSESRGSERDLLDIYLSYAGINLPFKVDKLMEENKMPHLLLYGPPGTGKTSTILSIARKLNGSNYRSMTLELNASDDRKISVVRERIKDFASTKTIFDTGLKLVILDEADAMTSDAQAALRRIIENYSRTTRFCLICNHINKIIPAIQSRCTKFRFGPLKESQLRARLEYIAEQEK